VATDSAAATLEMFIPKEHIHCIVRVVQAELDPRFGEDQKEIVTEPEKCEVGEQMWFICLLYRVLVCGCHYDNLVAIQEWIWVPWAEVAAMKTNGNSGSTSTTTTRRLRPGSSLFPALQMLVDQGWQPRETKTTL
jgi:hypothetical protein